MRRQFCHHGAAALVWLAMLPAVALGQAAWEYTPYEARVWLAFEPVPQLPAALTTTVGSAVTARCGAVWGAVMQVQFAAPPSALRAAMLHDLDGLTVDAIAAAAERRDLEADKLYLAAIVTREGGPV